ncbi:cytochrome c and c1 heme-lyase [Gonapodya prolifera JEL478]|uniref:Holocytochrome c-type synthase n=1 Tax=Gonapodya prolifera (strain JEL478) TaxID=1344416 RepID=A0A139A9W2_GONPJ|nr:cytochrome c and c1 heme-lyase [Gonapodya prolifera JEL478]|eukprot:KXS13478.1 cytochrome c and c1 heme-lyase [Gonapodya prolifera JEL478]
MGSLPPDHPFYKHQQDYLRKQEAESTKERINPRNMMPELSQSPHPEQRVVLPTERTFSTIPKSESTDMDEKSYGAKTDTTWVYPSPQQFYNALKRKGWETPEEEIPVMVQIHNFLNEACWHEILRWERMHQTACGAPTLLRFQGRPSELSPKARLYTTLLGTPPPFDRHDWTVDRCGKPVRYVIDYYSGPDEVDGNPSFIVDVRPALDSPTAVVDRLRMVMKSFTDRWSSGEAAPQT